MKRPKPPWLQRLQARWWLLTHVTDALDRRVYVEKILRDCASGKRPLPSRDDCLAMAFKLSVPS